MINANRIIALDRDDMSDLERELFLKDLKRVYDEYFETCQPPALEITRADDGFIVCVLVTAHRIKSLKKLQ